MESIKRVEALYRVSTKDQSDSHDDIPMQKNACRNFIDKQNWKLVKEYTELGVSGFSKSAKDRDAIQQLMKDAEKGLFDVLLVFMFDRLGRKDNETPFVVEWFSKKGIEVWSVKEGEQRFDNHTDQLINYLRYWQSAGESKKTSMRVSEKHTQMIKEGQFRGGTAPYGYRLVKSGISTRKGKELKKLEIDEHESVIVQEIYRLVYEEGLGGSRIASLFNEKGVPSKTGSGWRASVINYIIRNPIYKGYMVYNKTSADGDGIKKNMKEDWVMSDKPLDELTIVTPEIWDNVQEVVAGRKPLFSKSEGLGGKGQTRSPLLFVGMIKCGHCGSPLTTTYKQMSHTVKDGERTKTNKAIYRCSGKAQKSKACDGQSIYNQKKLEALILEKVEGYLDQLRQVDLTTEIQKFKQKNVDVEELEVKRVRKSLEEAYEEIAALKKEIAKSIMGKSSFSPDILSDLIKEKDKEIAALDQKLEIVNELVSKKMVEVTDMLILQQYIPVWKDDFHKASTDKQKVLLSKIIKSIFVYRDKIEVNINTSILQLVDTLNRPSPRIHSGS